MRSSRVGALRGLTRLPDKRECPGAGSKRLTLLDAMTDEVRAIEAIVQEMRTEAEQSAAEVVGNPTARGRSERRGGPGSGF